MLRVMGSIMVMAGCLGLGVWYRCQLKERLYHLRCMGNILEMMMSEVRYSKASLPECCLKLSSRLDEPYRSAFADVCHYMEENTGEGFAQVFRSRMEECLGSVNVGGEEKDIFLQFASLSGYEDGHMQLSAMEQYRELLDDLTKRLESEIREKSRMALGLGVMGGLLLVIILL